jgi:hypothetical protein
MSDTAKISADHLRRRPAIAKIVSRADRAVGKLLSHLVREGQGRGQVDPGLDPDSVAEVLHSIINGLNRLGAVRDPTFDVKAASAMLKLLLERFLKPRAGGASKRATALPGVKRTGKISP